jgi:serine/threonine protein kinase
MARPDPDDPDDPNATVISIVDPMVGQVVATHYRIEIGIAAGGFGAIYRAVDLRDDRDVAIKLLHPHLTQDPAVLARFEREGRALAQLRGPHTITAYESGEMADGTLYIVMELLDGENLYETFEQLGPLPWRRVVAIAQAVCTALCEAHALGIVHRDLKPANIHLGQPGAYGDTVKVLDFGIAKIIHGDGGIDNSDLTQVGHMIGTFDYMPPEQMVGGECTGQSDIFTLGVVMYEMISGHRPFGEHATATQMLAAVLAKHPRPLGAVVEVPPELDRIIQRTLARTPAQRYASADELAADLAALLPRQVEAGRTVEMAAVIEDDTIVGEQAMDMDEHTLLGIIAPKPRP